MRYLGFYICLMCVSFSAFSQAINAYDINGKRHGIWKKTFEGTTVKRYEGEFWHGKEVGTFKFYKNIKGKAVLSATRDFNNTSTIAEVTFFTSKGKVISKGKMRGKTYVGTWKYYQKDNDELLILEHFNEKGQLDGERFVYYRNGQVAEQTYYKNNKLDGKSIYYSENGTVLKTFIYVNDELHGGAKFFDAFGKLSVEGQYKNGKKHGEWHYYEHGELKETKEFS